MNRSNCDGLQEKLVSAEPLDRSELGHLEACPVCGPFAESVRAIEDSARAARKLRVPPADSAVAVREQVDRRTRRLRPAFRLAWSSSALLAGMATVVLVLSGPIDGSDAEQPEQRLLNLLDEVGAITALGEIDSGAGEGEAEFFTAGLLLSDGYPQDDLELSLPGSYLLIEEVLENDRL